MTIDESKTVLTTNREHWERLLSEGICDAHEGKETISALTIAHASLEAWEAIRQEIDEQYDRVHPYNISCAEGLEMALEIIDKYKAESEVQDADCD